MFSPLVTTLPDSNEGNREFETAKATRNSEGHPDIFQDLDLDSRL